MPLTDLVRHLNSQTDRLPAGRVAAEPFVSTDGRVSVRFADLRLESVFLPLTAAGSGRVPGHAAALRVYGWTSGRPVSPDAVFVLPADDREFVYVDRLVRTLHALNYLTHPDRGALLLKVHRRHVMSVPTDHGLAFEEILRPCGLIPEQITLELDGDGIEDLDHFKLAVANYRQRGYGIALSGFGRSAIDFSLLRALRPDIVKLDPLLLASPRPLDRIIAQIHELGAQVLVEAAKPSKPGKPGRIGRAGIDLIEPRLPVDGGHLVRIRPPAGRTELLRQDNLLAL